MAYWDSKAFIDVGDVVGNHKRIAIGVVTVGSRTTIGMQLNPDNPRDNPDYTLDETASVELVRELTQQLTGLGRALGGGSQ